MVGFKTGDKVKLKSDLVFGMVYGETWFLGEQEYWKDKTLTITHI